MASRSYLYVRLVIGATAVVAAALGVGVLGQSTGTKAELQRAISKWQRLIDSNQLAEARAFCEECVWNKDKRIAAEGHKCLANVELAGASTTIIDTPKGRGGTMRGGYAGPGVDRALAHLKQGMALAPDDLSIHQGRLHVLIGALRYSELPAAVEDSIKIYKGKDAPDRWLDYCSELMDFSHYEEGLAFTEALEKHYGNDHRVVANIGAFLVLLERDAEAVKYLTKAVAMKPDDPINNWNLGRYYDYANNLPLADRYYLKGLSMEKDKQRLRENYCVYATFLEKKLKQSNKACELQKRYCPSERQSACKPKG